MSDLRDMPPDLQLQLVWDRLLALVEEHAHTLMRTAFSTGSIPSSTASKNTR